MEKTKKESAAWNIAGTYYLTTMFVPVFIGNTITRIITTLLLRQSPNNPIIIKNLAIVFSLIFWSLIVWVGALYSSQHINKTYHITNKTEIIKIAMIYFIIIAIILRCYELLILHNIVEFIAQSVLSIILGVIFYKVGHAYIKNNTINE
jgi:hypothetical protein